MLLRYRRFVHEWRIENKYVFGMNIFKVDWMCKESFGNKDIGWSKKCLYERKFLKRTRKSLCWLFGWHIFYHVLGFTKAVKSGFSKFKVCPSTQWCLFLKWCNIWLTLKSFLSKNRRDLDQNKTTGNFLKTRLTYLKFVIFREAEYI